MINICKEGLVCNQDVVLVVMIANGPNEPQAQLPPKIARTCSMSEGRSNGALPIRLHLSMIGDLGFILLDLVALYS